MKNTQKRALEKFLKTMYFKDLVDFDLHFLDNIIVLSLIINHNKFDINSKDYDSYYADIINNFLMEQFYSALDFFIPRTSYRSVKIFYVPTGTEILDSIVDKLSDYFGYVKWVRSQTSPYVNIEIVTKDSYLKIFEIYKSLNINHNQYMTDRITPF